ncbi:unnamed protein product [Schistosoma curassoni]|uniref:Uncharacterized protein n=1 Tax=Schistosoma curassoni TaxID=6186 RepID=A0A183L5F8_9TREM|nr:unnamed protein product [Schistosoma curassoni]
MFCGSVSHQMAYQRSTSNLTYSFMELIINMTPNFVIQLWIVMAIGIILIMSMLCRIVIPNLHGRLLQKPQLISLHLIFRILFSFHWLMKILIFVK